MKTLLLFLVICITFNSSLFAQYYIGQDKIDLLKNKKDKSFSVGKDFEPTNLEVYLEKTSTGGYLSDVRIGFDKLKYSRGDVVTLTFDRTGSNADVEDEYIFITSVSNATGDGFEITKLEGYGYLFQLKENEVKKVFIKLVDRNQPYNRIGIGIGKVGSYRESRGFIIPYNLNKSKQKFYKLDREKFKYPQGQSLLKTDQTSSTTINVSGTIQYVSPIDDITLQPVNHWSLLVCQGNVQDPVLLIEQPQYYRFYEINSTGNGIYSQNITLSYPYYTLVLVLDRLEYGSWTYRMGVLDGNDWYTWFPIENYAHVNDGQNTQYSYTFDYSYGEMEAMRRDAYIASRIDVALTTNVGENLSLLQNLVVVSPYPTQAVNKSYTQIKYDPTETYSMITIGNRTNGEDLLDGTVIHEYGHSLVNAINNYYYDRMASGVHGCDQKSNTHLAFSEGWADFWACAVLNQSNLYTDSRYGYNLNLSTVNKSYIYSITSPQSSTYLPNGTTIYDGVESEALIAAGLWKLKETNSLTSVWTGMKSTVAYGTETKPVLNFLDFLAANSSLKNSLYSDASFTENLGLGRSFVFLTGTTNLQNTIPALSDKTLIYIQKGVYVITSPIVIDSKSFGIVGMGLNNTILKGQANQNIVTINNPNSNNNWNKVSDMQFQNANYSIETLSSGTNQPKIYLSRCSLTSGINGISLGGDAILFNNVISNNSECGIYVNSMGSSRNIYFYNNVIDNCNIGLRFNNSVSVLGHISNNMFNKNDGALASVDQGATQYFKKRNNI